MTSNNYQVLITKLDEFIRKYYKNQLIRGALYVFAALLGAWLVFTSLEYFGHFGTTVRTILFWSFIAAAAFSLWRLVLTPLFHLNRLGKIISHEQAAFIIGTHFTNVKDKLLNTLQLKAESDRQGNNNQLLLAGIEQKIEELKPVSFASAIDLRNNRKYVKYAAVPLAVFLVLVFAAPSLLIDGSERLMKHTTHFETPAPFNFKIENEDLTAVQSEDFLLDVKVDGNVVPNDVYIEIDGNQFRLDKENRVNFNYTFRNIQKSTSFHLFADGYTSREYTLKAIPNPSVLNFNISLVYPAYTDRQPETLSNTGDLTIPAGTRVKWEFNARNADELELEFRDTSYTLKATDNLFVYSRSFAKSSAYLVKPSNEFMESKEPMEYAVNVIPDLYPTIQSEQQQDSMSSQLLYFKGMIRDDYGFSKLAFSYRFIKTSEENLRNKGIHTEVLSINKNANQDQFFHSWNMQQLMVEPGEEIEYYFEVWDNDGVNGAKSARTQSMIFRAPSLKELAENADKNADKMKSDLEKSIQQSKKLQKDMSDIARDMLEKKNLNYDDRKKIEDVLKQQQQLEQQVEDLKKRNQQNNTKENEYRRNSEQIMEKKQKLDELFEKLMSEEMKKLMRELEKLLAELDKEQVKEMVDKMKLDQKDLEKELDRTLELFKQLEVEQKLQEAIDKLDELSKEQKSLAKKTEEDKSATEEIKKDQEELNKEFEDLKKEMSELQKKNEELENPQEIDDNKEEMEDIDKDMEESEKQLGEKQSKKAGKSQKSAAEKMDQLSQKMKQQQQQQDEEQAEEDMQALRALLENLIRFSLNQEGLMEELKSIDVNNPRFTKLAQRQRELKDDAKVLEDSLFALSKRVVQISSIVNTEIAAINDNIGKSIAHLQDRYVPQARSEQQYVMTSVNNLALILTEAFDQMQQQQQQQQQQKKGNGNCKKPGSGKPSPSAEQARKMQEKINEQMKALKKKMEGQQKGEGKKKGGGEGSSGMSEELARLAAQQEALRNELQKLNNEENKDGQGSLGNLDKVAKQMEETEKDLVNKRITQETINRQEEILTRLLESEKAEREREQDEKRQSNEGQDNQFRNTGQFEEYKKLKMKEVELLKTIPPGLNAFYKNLVNYYFQTLEN
ncbi:MAG: DUF4175 domain-containing protein [Bacteroidota bacterium]|nr:DUF4175 domain-containing protein [Bacteroidota bacterium]